MPSLLLAYLLLCPQAAAPNFDSITVDTLKTHERFLASDALEGRGTPSFGLDMAADYIANQFKKAGLEPGVDGTYFQVATDSSLNEAGFPTVKNVVGILRGSDPALKDTYVMLTAHYDHLGISERRAKGDDKIMNGANDDASGTTAVMEIARVLGAMQQRPKRSLIFVALFGEERGLFGSRYYGDHPVVPLKDTVADFNIEMIGRTIKDDGNWSGRLGLTGYDYTDMADVLKPALAQFGIELVFDKEASDPFFMRSDNAALAAAGIPAHTVSTGYEDPWYHQANDNWDSLDYDNMLKTVRGLANAALALANSEKAPQWNPNNPRAAKYLETWKRLHNGG
ncbi:MAG TPA: M28 family peptidase [Fimbriimonadaceae bacterium]|nr:M28 family peptidase [Fimbriimonadaceae bacterium]